MGARIDQAVTSGTFSLDGGTFDVDNNVWVIGDDDECVVDRRRRTTWTPSPRSSADRKVLAILCTHAHDDHVRPAPAAGDRFGAPVLLHPADRELWGLTHPDVEPGRAAGRRPGASRSAGVDLQVLHTPGHAPGVGLPLRPGRCGTVFTGDTLFAGRPGRDRPQLQRLPDDRRLDPRAAADPAGRSTVVRTGHGDSTTIAAEAPGLLDV